MLRVPVTPAHLRFLLLSYLIGQVIGLLFVVSTGTPLDRLGRIVGRDFMQFYLAGRTVADGESARLYNIASFAEMQASITPITPLASQYYPLYPPQLAMLFVPLGACPYLVAVGIWWAFCGGMLFLAGRMLLAPLLTERGWQAHDLWLGLVAFHPVVQCFWYGQLGLVWLLIFLGALRFLERKQSLAAGLVFSCLALKPQFLPGVGLFLLLARDYRALLGLALGVVAQVLGVGVILGFSIWVDYLEALRQLYPVLHELYQFSPQLQQSITGIVANVFGERARPYGLFLHLLAMLGAAYLAHRSLRQETPSAPRRALAVGVILVLLCSAHLLLYDLVLLLIPVSYLANCRRTLRRMGYALYLSGAIALLYDWIGFSPVPLLLLAALWCCSLASQAGGWQEGTDVKEKNRGEQS